MKFILDERLKADTFFLSDLKLSKLLLMNDQNYPWLILVPRINNSIEITDLAFVDQAYLLKEINHVAAILKQEFVIDKLNIANLGNMVSQLHVHVIGRRKDDISFPKPVWGQVAASPYCEKDLREISRKIRIQLDKNSKELEELLIESSAKEEESMRIKKMRYRSNYRGCKETDVLLGQFFNHSYRGLEEAQIAAYEEMLDEDDALIYDWIVNKLPTKEKYQELVKLISHFHLV